MERAISGPEDKIDIERLQAQQAALETSLAMQTELTKCILDGQGIHGLTAALADFMKCAAVLEDSDFSRISVAFPEERSGEKGLEPYLSVQTSPSFMKTARNRCRIKPILVEDDYGDFTIHRLVSSAVVIGGQTVLLSLARSGASYNEVEAAAFEHAADLFSVQLAQDKKMAEIELRLKGNFVEDLISANLSDSESVLTRSRALDYNILLPHRVLVAEIDNMKQIVNRLGADQAKLMSFKTELVQKIQGRLNLSARGMVIHKNEEIVLLVQQNGNDTRANSLRELAEDIIEEVSALFKVKLYIGIGSSCADLSDYKKSYLAAKKALEIGEYMITEGQVRSFEQFKIHELFLSTVKQTELYNYARGQLKALLDYDENHKTEMLTTLQEFLYLRNNLEATAKSINISVSGLKYRLQKIEKIIGLSLKDYKVCFDLQLAMVILQTFGEYKIRNGDQ